MCGFVQVRETITFDGGTLEILVTEKLDYNVMPPISDGTFVGHGTGTLKGVKVMGESYTELSSMTERTLTREGTIMGWTGLP